MPAKVASIRDLNFDLFARLVDEDCPERPEDYVEDWQVILAEYQSQIVGDSSNPAVAAEVKIRSLKIRLARFEILLQGPRTPEKDEFLRGEGINPDNPDATFANVRMLIAIQEQALDKLDKKEAAKPWKYDDFMNALDSIGEMNKMQYDPLRLTVLRYCQALKRAEQRSKAIEAINSKP